MPTMRAILVGAVDSSQVALEALARSSGWTVAAVVTLDQGLNGRHSDFVDLGPAAAKAGCPVIRVDNINRDAALSAIGAVVADYIFVIGWSQICGPHFLDLAKDRVIGYHPTALPRMRGRAAIPWTILNDEPITAGTLFWIDHGTDTGDVLDQQYFHVAPDETAATLYAKHMEALSAMLDRSLPALADGRTPRRQQNEACATWTARRTPAEGRIDWSAPAENVLRLIRASGRPYPGAFTQLGETPLQIWAASYAPLGNRHCARPGQVLETCNDGFTVMCGANTAIMVTDWSGASQTPRRHALLGAAER